MTVPRRLALLAVPLAVALVTTGCGRDKPAANNMTSAPSKGTTFVLDEWSIVPPTDALSAGKVQITATNEGKETHELVIVRVSDAASLKTKADGSVDETEIPDSKKAGEISDLAAGKSATKTFDLPAGDYLAFCNLVEDMSGGHDMGSDSGMDMGNGGAHVHYQRGMVNAFTVA